MKFTWRCIVTVVALSTGLWGCSGADVRGGTTPTPEQKYAAEAPPAPEVGLAVTPLSDDWMPVSYGSGRGHELTAVLAGTESVALVLGKGATAVFEEQVVRMVQAASPKTKIVARERSMVDLIMKERGELPQRVTMEAAGVDILGRPYVLPKEHPLNTDWLTKKGALKGARGMLTASRITVDNVTLKRMRGKKQGGCEKALEPLRSNMANAASYFSAFKSEMDTALAGSFQNRISVALPFWQDELDAIASSVGDANRKCIAKYQDMLGELGRCDGLVCDGAPVLRMVEGGVVAMSEIGSALPTGCVDLFPRNYVDEVYELSQLAVQDVLESFNGPWLGEMIRYGSLEALALDIEKICRPRHRRIDPKELAAAQLELSQFSAELSEQQLDAHWHLSGGQVHVQGIGPARIFARVQAVGSDPRERSRAIGSKIQKLDRCDDMGERFLQVSLIDVGTSEVRFLGIMFAEEILCGDMAP